MFRREPYRVSPQNAEDAEFGPAASHDVHHDYGDLIAVRSREAAKTAKIAK